MNQVHACQSRNPSRNNVEYLSPAPISPEDYPAVTIIKSVKGYPWHGFWALEELDSLKILAYRILRAWHAIAGTRIQGHEDNFIHTYQGQADQTRNPSKVVEHTSPFPYGSDDFPAVTIIHDVLHYPGLPSGISWL